jgi:hypothetical protein
MTRATVLAAAAALGHFTVAEAAAYCDEGADAVTAILTGAHGVEPEPGSQAWEPGNRRWQVTDPAALRHAIASSGTGRQTRRRVRAVGATRLLLAEELLLDCGTEPSAEARQLMAATAANHLRQYVAGLATPAIAWWEVEMSDVDALVAGIHTEAGTVTAPRLRVDFAIARLVDSEAVGGAIELDWLIDTAVQLTRLPASVGEDRLRALFHRFTELAVATIAGAERSPAPARLLFALAWRRALALGEQDPAAAAESLLRLLRGIERHTSMAAAGRAPALYRVLNRLPDGRERVAVYADLLDVLPRQYGFDPVELVVPGAIVHADADPAAAAYLEECAQTLALDLEHSPFRSDSALIGQAAHVFQDLAVKASFLDDSVVPRSERMRTELLSLANVAV